MSRKYKFHYPEGVYFVSFAVQEWVDACLPVGMEGRHLSDTIGQ
jgi:hypothetical protein